MINPKLIQSIEKQLYKLYNGTGYGNVTMQMTDFMIETVVGKEKEQVRCKPFVTISGCLA